MKLSEIKIFRINDEVVWNEGDGEEKLQELINRQVSGSCKTKDSVVDSTTQVVEEVKEEVESTPEVEEKSTTSLPEGRSKKELAIEIFNSNRSMSRGECIDRFMKELNMTKAGASTYYANCKKV